MRNIIFTLALCILSLPLTGQHFLATIDSNVDTLIFKITPNGGDITTGWSDIEFFVRWPDGAPGFSFGNIVVNTAQFPGISIPDNGNNAQGSEPGFTNNWFGTSFTATANQTYQEGAEYWVFKVVVNGPAQALDVGFELCHNSFFFPHYLALTDGAGSDLTAPGSDLKFYGADAQVCGPVNCPVSTAGTNHVATLLAALPVELLSFDVHKVDEKSAFLEWTSSSETNVSHFEIERSTDAYNWEYLQSSSAIGNSDAQQHYYYEDETVGDWLSKYQLFYYRLKMVDFDHSFEYSDIRSVEFDHVQPNWLLYPNPTTDGVFIKTATVYQTAQLFVYDALGGLVIEQTIGERDASPYFLSLKSKGLSSGTYFVKILSGGNELAEQRFKIQLL